MKLVSIIIPIYNVEKFLEECLNSAINQSYTNIEVIAVNDGSPDGSGEIIEKFVAKDKRVKHIRQKNQGAPMARLNGIIASSGDYLLHLDGDDFLTTNCVEHLLAEAIQHNADVVYSDAYRWENSDNYHKIITNPHNKKISNGIEYFEARITTFMWGKLYKREVSENLTPQTINVNDDLFFNLQILPRCKKIAYLRESVYYYRNNPNSIMSDKTSSVVAQYFEHAIQRRALDLDQRIKDVMLYDNIRIIFRYLKYIGIDNKIKSLIDITYSEYKFPLPKSFKELKLDFFFIITKCSTKAGYLLIKLSR